MSTVRLILALHNHQPVGNFDGVFEAAYRESYLPFLEVLENYPEIPFSLHTSGPLLEWLVERHPEYIARVRALVETGRVEILGGGFFEPIMTMIPHQDRVGQIRDYTAYLQELFPTRIRGMWVPERVWEQHLVSAIAEAGIEYTVLDDFHFQRAGVTGDDLFGYYLTEDEGRLLKIFPGSETLRYTMPFQEPHATYEFLRRLAERKPGATVVFADDGEKFGSWPDTFDHVYTRGWLNRFCDMILGNRDWLEVTTLWRTVDATLPLGKVYVPDGSYREMTEWVLPPALHQDYELARSHVEASPLAEEIKPFFRAGGYWRNFKARYPESDEMYARMLGISRRLAAAATREGADPDYLEIARRELYRGQCNCPYWHGAFGGLYLPHLRNAHLPEPDHRPQRARRRRGQDRAAGLAGDRRLQPRRASGGEARERPPDRTGAARAGRAPLRAGRPADRDQRPGDARAPARSLPQDRDRGDPSGKDRHWQRRPSGQHSRPRGPEAGGSRPAAGLRPASAQGPRRSLLSDRRDARRPGRLPRGRAWRFRHGGLPVQGPARPEASGPRDGTAGSGRRPRGPDQEDDRAGRRTPRR